MKSTVQGHPVHTHPIELALLLAVITIEAMRTLAVHLLALVLTVAGYRPKGPKVPTITTPAPAAEPCGADGEQQIHREQDPALVDPPATPAPRSRAATPKRSRAAKPQPEKAPSPRPRRRKSPVPIADS